MTQAMTLKDGGAALMEKVLLGGDLSKLTSAERLSFYNATCKSLGLNALTKPFDYITLNGKLTLYARKDATEQLRKIHGVSVTKLEREVTDGVYTVTAYLEDRSGRKDSSIGAVSIEGLKGEAKANAVMKSETKAKRRGTLSICGLGILDETEIETIPDAKPFVEQPTGGIFTGAPSGSVIGKNPTLIPTPPDEVEITLAKSCLIAVMDAECFTDRDRKGALQWLGKNPSLDSIKKKLRDKQEWVEAWKKETAQENQDADPVSGSNSPNEVF